MTQDDKLVGPGCCRDVLVNCDPLLPDRLSAAREGVVKALENLEREALLLRQHWTCDKCSDHNVYAACEAARAALKELEEAQK